MATEEPPRINEEDSEGDYNTRILQGELLDRTGKSLLQTPYAQTTKDLGKYLLKLPGRELQYWAEQLGVSEAVGIGLGFLAQHNADFIMDKFGTGLNAFQANVDNFINVVHQVPVVGRLAKIWDWDGVLQFNNPEKLWTLVEMGGLYGAFLGVDCLINSWKTRKMKQAEGVENEVPGFKFRDAVFRTSLLFITGEIAVWPLLDKFIEAGSSVGELLDPRLDWWAVRGMIDTTYLTTAIVSQDIIKRLIKDGAYEEKILNTLFPDSPSVWEFCKEIWMDSKIKRKAGNLIQRTKDFMGNINLLK